MKKTIFIGAIYPSERKEEIKMNSKSGLDNASNNLCWSILEGLVFFYSDISVVSLTPIGTFPLNYKKMIFKESSFSREPGVTGYCLGFVNIFLIKHLHKYLNLKNTLFNKFRINNESLIIAYGVQSPLLKALYQAKIKFPGLKICLIVPDLPEYMSESRNQIYLLLKRFDSFLISKYLEKIDSFVLLTECMADKLKVKRRPWVRIEGVIKPSEQLGTPQKESYRTIFYSGGLEERYGLLNLLEAFHRIKSEDYRLWICGEGSLRSNIEKSSLYDKRIKYFGYIEHNEVLLLQKKATVLVNPRTNSGDFTKYSFPSKIMEYLASGTPTIIHRLGGIPDEYYEYCYVAEKQTAMGLKEMIIKVCLNSQSNLDEFGRKASEFIKANKNHIAQVRKIHELINKI